MPITQDRMLSILEAAEAFQTSYSNLLTSLSFELRQLQFGQVTQAELVVNLSLLTNPQPLAHEQTVIAVERTKWNLTHTKNDRDKRKQEIQRRRDGRAKQEVRPSAIPTRDFTLPRWELPIKPGQGKKPARTDEEIAAELACDPNDSMSGIDAMFSSSAPAPSSTSLEIHVDVDDEDKKYNEDLAHVAEYNQHMGTSWTLTDAIRGKVNIPNVSKRRPT